MRPLLKVNRITNLQDARSSAAVGVNLLSFSLERGDDRKLPAKLIWSMTNWLSGVEIVLNLNLQSLGELKEVGESFDFQWVGFPAEEWDNRLWEDLDAIILSASSQTSPEAIAQWIAEVEEQDKRILIELAVNDSEQLGAFEAVFPHLLLHFSSVEELQSFAATSPLVPAGFVLGEEAEEGPGELDYQRIDEFIEVFEARFGEG
ncbi:MAG: hypothetical protein AAF399_03900 [Bacteroidota bacterium]